MRATAWYALAAAAANVIGALAVTMRPQWGARAHDTIMSFAAGFLVSVALLDMLPKAILDGGASAPAVAFGAYVLVHITQHTLGRHFHFGEETHAVSKLVGVTALAGLLMHTLADGVALSSAARESEVLGALVFVAVVLHKVPEGLAISSLFIAAGSSRRTALLAAAALGVSTIVGVVLTESLVWLQTHGLAIAAGVTLYVGASNLVPEIQQTKGWRVPAGFIAGCVAYWLGRSLLPL
jgi:zinc and cadmium transporter